MLLGDQSMAAVLAFLALVALEVWRRSLRRRAPTWVHAVTLVLLVAIAGGAAYSQIALRRLAGSLGDLPASEKTTELAAAISRAMGGYVLSIVATAGALVVLGVASFRARRVPDGGPVARVR